MGDSDGMRSTFVDDSRGKISNLAMTGAVRVVAARRCGHDPHLHNFVTELIVFKYSRS